MEPAMVVVCSISAALGVLFATVFPVAVFREIRRLDRMATEAHQRSLMTDARCKVWCEQIGVKPVEHGSMDANDRRKAQEGKT